MRWDRFFEDLEDQLDSEWEAERAALDTEAERLRLARIPLRDRLVVLAETADVAIGLELTDGTTLSGTVTRVGSDWVAVTVEGGSSGTVWIVPLAAVATMALATQQLLGSVRGAHPGGALAQRMSLGFVVRDLVRRRIPVTVHLVTGRALSGTIDRAGADHLDLALHEIGAVRRADQVRGFRIVPFAAVAAMRLDALVDLV